MGEKEKGTSLPLVSDNRIKSCLFILGKFQPCPKEQFYKYDTKAYDISRFFRLAKIVDEYPKEIKEFHLSEIGNSLYKNRYDSETFRLIMHGNLLRHIIHYKTLFEIGKLNGFKEIERDILIQKLRPELVNTGFDLSIPTFNTLLTLGKAVNTLNSTKNLISFSIKLSISDFENYFKQLISDYLKANTFSENFFKRDTKDLLRFLQANPILKNSNYNSDVYMNYLVNNQEEFQIKFSPGIGSENIPSKYALIDYGDWLKR